MNISSSFLLLYSSIWLLTGCHSFENKKKVENENDTVQLKLYPINSVPISVSKNIKRWTVKDFYSVDNLLLNKVDSIFNLLSINERAAQLIMPGTGRSKDFGLPFSKIIQLYKAKIIGGVLFLKGTRSLFIAEINKLKQASKNAKILPPIFSCDCEPTLFHKKFTDADSMTVASELKTTNDVMLSATAISKQMAKMGIHWNFAPVADISFNTEIINKRSFGSDTQQLVKKAIAFINSSADNNIVTTIKHFPGHGAVKGDSHRQLVYIDSTLTEVDNFKKIIASAKPISIMMGHIAIKNNSLYNTNSMPASLSNIIINELLKNKIGFSGIVISDAMNMGAVKNIAGADYLAILAGNDLVLMPQNVELLHKKLVKDLLSNTAQKIKLEISIKKVLKLKICLNII